MHSPAHHLSAPENCLSGCELPRFHQRGGLDTCLCTAAGHAEGLQGCAPAAADQEQEDCEPPRFQHAGRVPAGDCHGIGDRVLRGCRRGGRAPRPLRPCKDDQRPVCPPVRCLQGQLPGLYDGTLNIDWCSPWSRPCLPAPSILLGNVAVSWKACPLSQSLWTIPMNAWYAHGCHITRLFMNTHNCVLNMIR